MRNHLAYLSCVLRHKWYVFVECCKLGIPLLGIVHDLSKFSLKEWRPHVRNFYNKDGTRRSRRDATGYYDATQVSDDFDYAWLNHQHHNKHHWQYWILKGDSGKLVPKLMPARYLKEMVADWKGAGKAPGTPNVQKWYIANCGKIRLHPMVRHSVLQMLGLTREQARIK